MPTAQRRKPVARPGARAAGAPAPKVPKAPKLPASTPAKLEDLLALMDSIIDENVDVFIDRAQKYREKHREGTKRNLTAMEAAQLAAATISSQPVEEIAVRYQQSGLTAHDEATPAEFLLVGGIATAPAFMAVVQRFVALVEMPNEDHERHHRNQTLDEALDDAADTLRFQPLKESRERALYALQHFSAEAGIAPGKGLGVLAKMLLQVVTESMGHLTTAGLLESASTSLTSSAASTDGPSESADSD